MTRLLCLILGHRVQEHTVVWVDQRSFGLRGDVRRWCTRCDKVLR